MCVRLCLRVMAAKNSFRMLFACVVPLSSISPLLRFPTTKELEDVEKEVDDVEVEVDCGDDVLIWGEAVDHVRCIQENVPGEYEYTCEGDENIKPLELQPKNRGKDELDEGNAKKPKKASKEKASEERKVLLRVETIRRERSKYDKRCRRCLEDHKAIAYGLIHGAYLSNQQRFQHSLIRQEEDEMFSESTMIARDKTRVYKEIDAKARWGFGLFLPLGTHKKAEEVDARRRITISHPHQR